MWTSSYFQDLYLKLYRDRLIEPQQTAAEAAMVRRIFPRPDEGPLLDLACGHGRHAIALAKKGYQIAGVDSQAAYLAAAQVEAERQGVSVDWIRADARRQPLASESMAGVYCLFNSWGYLGAEEACREAAAGRRSRPLARAEDPNFDILTDAARVLRPGGRLLLDLPHRPSLLRLVRAQPNLRMSSGDYDIQEKFAYSSEVGVLANYTVFRLGREKQKTGYFLRLYSKTELTDYLQAVGLKPLGWAGSSEGEPMERDSVRMIVWAKKNRTVN